NPAPGISRIAVNKAEENSIRVRIAGVNQTPSAEIVTGRDDLVLSITPEETTTAEEPVEEIEVIATGEAEDDDYRVDNATTATKTDTPLRDIPQSVQIVPQQVIEDRKPRNLTEAVETVSGVVDGGNHFGTPSGARIIRGFSQGFNDVSSNNYRNGFRDSGYFSLTGVGTIERVEVLKGPGSVLFGATEPGGIVNVITKQPSSESSYKLEFEAGNRNFYQPGIDFTDSLTTDDTLLYRLIANYQDSDGFQDFVETNLTTIAPSITWKIGDRTNLNLHYEYINFTGDPPEQYGGIFSDGSLIPQEFFFGYPQFNFLDITTQKVGYTLTHEFNDNLQIRNNLSVNLSDTEDRRALGNDLIDDRFLTDFYTGDSEYTKDNYFGQIDLLSKFKTATIDHQLLVGFDFNIFDGVQEGTEGGTLPNLDLFEPNYDVAAPVNTSSFSVDDSIEAYGIYLQDQIDLLDNVKLLLGGRFDWIEQSQEFIFDGDNLSDPGQDSSAFSPRVGLVYQPSDIVSLYASYSRSFFPTTGFNLTGDAFEPTRGTQYEIGIKTDFLEDRLSATLAAYNLTRTNVTTTDPENINFSIQVGEQRSQGIELDIQGEIVPGWNVTAAYAYTDAETTEDNEIAEGNRLSGVPENQASLWTTYTLQKGSLSGLGFGLGLFYIGDREGDLDNSFQLGDYFRTDAALFYRRGRLNTALNIRNLFDVDYFRATDGGRLFLQRGAPFTIVGSVSWEF
ncbi:MAG: TonB-dependent siderophore receptor, partial [Cyanobacteria bacterium P01_G01_bin.49]